MGREFRKRAPVNYSEVEEGGDGVDIDYQLAPAKKRKTKPLLKKNIFPFLSLPPELRNEVYKHAFGGVEEKWLVYKKVDHRRGVRLAASDEISSFVHGPTHPAAYARPKLIPNLLLANKQVYEEAVPILYGASFVFGDMKSLFQFLVNIGPNKKRFVQRLVIVHIGGDDMLAHTAFTHLRGLESLKELTIDGYMWSNVREIATRLYQLGVHWMEAVAAREGRHDAAVDIIALSYESLNLRGPQKTAQQKATQTSIVQERLRKLLRRR